jgi:hypothetical protein
MSNRVFCPLTYTRQGKEAQTSEQIELRDIDQQTLPQAIIVFTARAGSDRENRHTGADDATKCVAPPSAVAESFKPREGQLVFMRTTEIPYANDGGGMPSHRLFTNMAGLRISDVPAVRCVGVCKNPGVPRTNHSIVEDTLMAVHAGGTFTIKNTGSDDILPGFPIVASPVSLLSMRDGKRVSIFYSADNPDGYYPPSTFMLSTASSTAAFAMMRQVVQENSDAIKARANDPAMLRRYIEDEILDAKMWVKEDEDSPLYWYGLLLACRNGAAFHATPAKEVYASLLKKTLQRRAERSSRGNLRYMQALKLITAGDARKLDFGTSTMSMSEKLDQDVTSLLIHASDELVTLQAQHSDYCNSRIIGRSMTFAKPGDPFDIVLGAHHG